jgi:hypothetical protein
MVKQYQLQVMNLVVIWYMMMNNDPAIDFFKNFMMIKSILFVVIYIQEKGKINK